MVIRRIAAVLALDVVGYSRRMADDELSTLNLLHDLKAEILSPAFERHNGRVFKEMGDGFLAEFASVVDAVECAHEIQTAAQDETSVARRNALQMRIGIHFGEIIAEGDDLFGDTVNIAARIESQAEMGGVWISEQARQMLGNRVKLQVVPKGAHHLKNIPDPVPLFALVDGPAETAAQATVRRPVVSKRGILAAAIVALIAGFAAFGLMRQSAWQTTVEVDQKRPQGFRHAETFKECEACPEMVALAGGTLLMGAPADRITSGEFTADQGPQRLVAVDAFAVGLAEVTREEFQSFLSATNHQSPVGCRTWEDGVSSVRSDRSFEDPGYAQTADHPAVCLSWHDAQAYVDWLARETGQPYRLLSEAEWEYMARAGNDARFSFGEDLDAICRFDNIADATARSRWPNWETAQCSDGKTFTASVRSYQPNAFGIYDVYGNAREWVRDCWRNTLEGAPNTSEARLETQCDTHVVRGGSWDSKPSLVSSSWRGRIPSDHRDFLYGLRVARDLSKD